MPLPTREDLETLDTVFYGLPIALGATNDSIDLGLLDTVFYGLPLTGNAAPDGTPAPTNEDALALVDTPSFVHIVSNTDTLALADIGTSGIPVSDEEALALVDSASFTIIVSNTDTLTLHDSGGDVEVEDTDTLALVESNVITVDEDSTWSLVIQIDQVIDEENSLMIGILPYAPAPVSDYTDPDNPFKPTIIIDGEVLSSNPETLPEDVSNASIYINLQNPGIGTLEGLCGLYSYSINLTIGGGTFSFLSENPIASIGQVLTIFGLQAVVTEAGPHISASGIGYITNGIFGTRAMNKQLLLVLQGTSMNGLTPGQALQSPTSQEWSTVKACAKALASAAGVSLGWSAHDLPLTDLFPQTGMTVRDALTGLAAKVGGVLVYTGSGYAVVDSIGGYGTCALLPDCHLLAPGGIQSPKLLDMDNSILIYPVESGAGISNDAESSAGALSSLGGIASFDMAETSELFHKKPDIVETQLSMSVKPKVPVYMDLPGDYKEPRARIRVTDASLVGGIVVLDDGVHEPEWPTLVSFPFATRTNASGKKQLVITEASLPSGISNGEFTLEVGYTRHKQPLVDEYLKKVSEETARKRQLIQFNQELIRAVAVAAGSVNTVFFGQLPNAGMIGSAQYDNVNVFGLIESVSLTSPGYLSVQTKQYTETNFLSPRALQDYYSATGESRP